ncbi:MAG: DUF4358 domain-containing protein [Lachnospiraceae bacterium]|nr:DUF4358 domain-containing protein [Robinsoniella sp.]MDY3765167.1 DUF4358 domain-containing protein [Lachnospiraceae bacterium]
MIKIMRGLKYICVVALVFFIGKMLYGEASSKALIDTVEEAVVSSMDVSGMEKANNRMVKRLYGLNANDYEGVCLYISSFNMNVEEILIVKLKDKSQGKTVEAAAENRRSTQLTNFDGYGVEQCKLLNDSILDVRGNYVLFVVSADAKQAEKAFLKSL